MELQDRINKLIRMKARNDKFKAICRALALPHHYVTPKTIRFYQQYDNKLYKGE